MTSHRSPSLRAAPSSIAAAAMSPAAPPAIPLRNTFSMSVRMARPPPPYLSVMRSSRTDTATRYPQTRMPPVLMPDLAGAFAADHARADRRFGQAGLAEQRAVGRRLDAGHDVAADAVLHQCQRRIVPEALEIDIELAAGIHVCPLVAEPQVSVRHVSDAAPPASDGPEHAPEPLLRAKVSLFRDAARKHVLHCR